MLKITSVRLTQVFGRAPVGLSPVEERQVGALDLYPEYRARVASVSPPSEATTLKPIDAIYVNIDTDAGLTGTFGPIMPDQAFQIATRLRPHLLGRDALAVERIWDVLARQDRHSRRGYMMMAISAVDIALWDLRGKAANMPVYRLLGGPTRDAVPAYASTLGLSLEPERVYERARALHAQGYTAEKWFFRYGPGDGPAAIEKNMQLVRCLREAVGDDVDLMFDAWLGWDLPFATAMAQRMAPYHPRWLEEPLQPDRVSGYAALHAVASIPIAAGEHEYTRWGFKTLLDSQCIDVLQADPDWTGGISEMVKICALASAYDKPVIPHGHSVLPALHVIAAQSPEVCPLLEYLLVHNPAKQWFQTRLYEPVNGLVTLPQEPGLGLTLDPSKIERSRELSWT